jgi:hypothetical protein
MRGLSSVHPLFGTLGIASLTSSGQGKRLPVFDGTRICSLDLLRAHSAGVKVVWLDLDGTNRNRGLASTSIYSIA